MKLVVGLGNPGSRYADTRHNAGFRIVERFAETRGIPLDDECCGGRFGRGWLARDETVLEVGLLEPQSYMNLSGDVVHAALARLPVGDPADDLLVVYDDVDLPFGRLRLRPGGGAGGHRGLAHLIERLERQDFPRLRFGVGRPAPPLADTLSTTDWVLQPFSPEERRALPERVASAADALEVALLDGVEAAMNRFNRDAAGAG